jgi:hypothetical protein
VRDRRGRRAAQTRPLERGPAVPRLPEITDARILGANSRQISAVPSVDALGNDQRKVGKRLAEKTPYVLLEEAFAVVDRQADADSGAGLSCGVCISDRHHELAAPVADVVALRA